jgi:hypothetical protein
MASFCAAGVIAAYIGLALEAAVSMIAFNLNSLHAHRLSQQLTQAETDRLQLQQRQNFLGTKLAALHSAISG